MSGCIRNMGIKYTFRVENGGYDNMFVDLMETELEQARKNHKNISIGIVNLNRIYNELTEEQKRSLDESFRIIWENIRRQ